MKRSFYSLLAGLALLAATPLTALAQTGVGIGTTAPNAKAALEIVAADKGLLLPRLTTAQRTAIAAPVPEGLLVYQTDGAQPGFWYYEATDGWTFLNPTNDNLGNHTATQSLNLGANQLVGNGGTSGLAISSAGNVGIGTTTPAQKLTVVGSAAVTGATTLSSATGAATTSSVLQVNGNQVGIPVADQVQNTSNVGGIINDYWQSFTAGSSGLLSQLAVYCGNAATVTLSVYAGQGTGGTLLHTQTISIGSTLGLQTFVLSAPVPVTAGQQYTFRLVGNGAALISFSNANPYAGGIANAGASYDLRFSTYVTASTAFGALTVLTNGQVGIGTTTPTQALDVSGTTRTTSLQVTGGTPAAGRVLTSDAGGTATWAAPLDASSTNELQTISKTGSTVTLSNGGGSVTDSDNQALTKSGSTISLSNGGSVTDSDSQTLSISGSTISLSNGGSVTVPSSADNLGNHTATQNLNLGTNSLTGTSAVNVAKSLNLGANKLVGNGGTTGLAISSAGVVTTDGQLNAGGNVNLGANQLVGNGGTTGISISSAGNVGIGPAAATVALQVSTAATLTGPATYNGTFGPNLNGSATVMASSEFSGSFLAGNIKDGNLTTEWAAATGQAWPQWVRYDFAGTPRLIRQYSVYFKDMYQGNAKTWTFEGSATGTIWTVLQTVAVAPYTVGWQTYGVPSNTTAYRYYRLAITEAQSQTGTDVGVTEWEVYEENVGSVPVPATALRVSPGALELSAGAAVREFSTDGTFSGNADDAVPTEKAVKMYVDAHSAGDNLGSHLASANLGLNGHWLSNGPGNANGIRVDNAGNVGVGTIPGAGFHVRTAEAGGLAGLSGVLLSGGASGNANVEVRGGTPYLDFASTLSADYTSRLIDSGAGLAIQTNGDPAARLFVASGGNVGIGTAVPAATLEVSGSTRLSSVAGTGTRMVTADNLGNLGSAALPVDTDAQQLTKAGSTISLTNGGSVTDADNQTLSISGSTISLTNGGSVTVPSSTDNLGNHTATQDLSLTAAHDLLVKDTNHGLGWYGPGKTWNSLTTDGPVLYGYDTGVLGIKRGATEQAVLYWNNAGNVGIGTTTPAQKLDVSGGIRAGASTAISAQGAYLQWNRTVLGETWLINQKGSGTGGICFGAADVANAVTEWARFDGSGNLGIGTTSPSQKLSVNGNICYTGSIGACSDARYKRDVTPLAGALAKVLQLRGVTYFWRQAEFPTRQFGPERQLGFIAQEIEPLYPEMVTTDAAGYKAVDYSRLTPVLVEAIKELQAQLDAQTGRAAHAEATLSAFEARLRALEAGSTQARGAGQAQARGAGQEQARK